LRPHGHDGKIQLDFNTPCSSPLSSPWILEFVEHRCHLSASFTPSVEAVKVGNLYLRVKPAKVYSNATDNANVHPEKTSVTFQRGVFILL
jgi:hypothetical protein